MAWSKEKMREYQKQWCKDNPDYHKNHYKIYRQIPKYRIRANIARQKHRENHPEREQAQQIFGRAVRRGDIIRQPCKCCGTTKNIHGHHPDYSKPLDVNWLCPQHHTDEHKKLREFNK